MDDEAVALLRLMAKMNAEVVRPAQMRREKNLVEKENGYNGDPAVCHHGEPSSSRIHSMDVPVQGPLPQLPLEGVRSADDTTPGHDTLCQPVAGIKSLNDQ